MDKDLEKMIKQLEEMNKLLESITSGKDIGELFNKKMEEVFKEKATISAKKEENGETHIKIEGSNLAILVTLAGLEKSILERTGTPSDIWEIIKKSVGTKEAE